MTTHTLASIRAAWAADGLGYSTDAPHGFVVQFYRNGLAAMWFTTGAAEPLWTRDTDAWTPGTLDDLARALGLKEHKP